MSETDELLMSSLGALFKEQILHYVTEENQAKQLISNQHVAELEVHIARIHLELESLTEQRRHLSPANQTPTTEATSSTR